MPLQNRVDPFGALHANPSRGLFTGNRGVLHDPETRTLRGRRWTTTAWIVCECDFQGRRRAVMGRNTPSGRAGWTELFFLDEVTALSAGHRPCFFCRRQAAIAFGQAFARGQGLESISAPGMDRLLHASRFAANGYISSAPVPSPEALPDGTMLCAGNRPFAVRGGRALPWDFDGYGPSVAWREVEGALRLLTPEPVLLALVAGFQPVWHPSAVAKP